MKDYYTGSLSDRKSDFYFSDDIEGSEFKFLTKLLKIFRKGAEKATKEREKENCIHVFQENPVT